MKENLSQIYLASPYSDPDPAVVNIRVTLLRKCLSQLVKEYDQYSFYSPISHYHEVAALGGLPAGWEFWKKLDRFAIEQSSALWVLTIDGWENSTGVSNEMTYAQELGLQVKLVGCANLPVIIFPSDISHLVKPGMSINDSVISSVVVRALKDVSSTVQSLANWWAPEYLKGDHLVTIVTS